MAKRKPTSAAKRTGTGQGTGGAGRPAPGAKAAKGGAAQGGGAKGGAARSRGSGATAATGPRTGASSGGPGATRTVGVAGGAGSGGGPSGTRPGFGAGPRTAWTLVVLALAGAAASWAGIIERLRADRHHRHFVRHCGSGAFDGCHHVIEAGKVTALGFPAPMLGMVAFGALLCFAMSLVAGARFARWLWAVAQAVAVLGAVLLLWLEWVSLHSLRAADVWWPVAWVAGLGAAWVVTLRNAEVWGTPLGASSAAARAVRWGVPALWAVVTLVLGLVWWA